MDGLSTEQLFTSSQVLAQVNISYRQLSYWELKGIIRPVFQKQGTRDFKRYTREDIDTLKKVKSLLGEGYSLPTTATLNEISKRKEMEDKLEKSEKRYKDLLDNANDIILSVDAQGSIVYFNRMLSELSGYSEKELLLMNVLEDLVAPDFRDKTKEYLALLCKGVDIKNMPQCFVKKNEQRLYLELNSTAVCDENNNFLRTRCILRDITERKRAEKVLRESEKQNAFKAELLWKAPVIAAFFDLELNMVWANKAYEKATGLSVQKMAGKKCYSVWGLTKSCRNCPVVKVIETGKPAETELTPQNQDHWPESQGCWLSMAEPVLDADGRILGAIETAIDITERKKAEDALRKSEAKYRELAASITDIFFAMDKDLRYTYWNRASEELTGIKAKDAIGRSIFEVFPDREDVKRAVAAYRKVLKTQQPQSFVNEYTSKGKRFFFEISAYPSMDGLSVFAKDITQNKSGKTPPWRHRNHK